MIKHRKLPVVLMLFLFGIMHVQVSHGQTPNSARSVLDAMIDALGGRAFLDVKDIQNSGRFYSFSRGDLSGSDIFVDYIKFPNLERTEFGRERYKSITINTGTEGWKIEGRDKDKKVDPQSPKQVDEFLLGFRTSFDYVTRFVLNLPKTTVQNLGGETIDFKRVDVIEVRDPDKNVIRFFIERTSHLPLKTQVRRANESVLHEELYSNWHKFQGVMTPLFVSRSKDGVKMMEIHLDTA